MKRLYQEQLFIDGLTTRLLELKKGVLVYHAESFDEYLLREENLPCGWNGIFFTYIPCKGKIKLIEKAENLPSDLNLIYKGYDIGKIVSDEGKNQELLIDPKFNLNQDSIINISDCVLKYSKESSSDILVGYNYLKPNQNLLTYKNLTSIIQNR